MKLQKKKKTSLTRTTESLKVKEHEDGLSSGKIIIQTKSMVIEKSIMKWGISVFAKKFPKTLQNDFPNHGLLDLGTRVLVQVFLG